MNEIALSVNALEFGHKKALFDALSFCCRRGEVSAILGANGRGKTSLLNTLSGVIPPLAGEISRSAPIGFVAQSFSSAFAYRVIEIVLMGRVSNVGLLQQPTDKDEGIAREALNTLGIAQLAEHSFQTLSGGQRQLVMIARALATGCEMLILDEPTSALDLYNQQAVLRLIHQLAKQRQISVLFTTHDPAHAQLVAQKCLLLLDNQRWVYGDSKEMLTEDNLLKAYGVRVERAAVSSDAGAQPVLTPIFDLAAD
ncbi:ABC transporter [Obesumbacterium proteus]|uniref:ABC transporter ATP-binding protein n=1 Tax=Obesumbacterium proteus TaxID=82983 RepID=UPI000621AC10|nr:ABC transporter ATP-binding protein [Obesumbacterium proteus]KKI44173.1 ABC transporter [Obesumbacterium proteus]